MKNYTLDACNRLIDRYVNELGGEMTVLHEGCLGLGEIVLHRAEGKKTIVIKEYYINANSSGHKVRMYNRMPKKYERAIEKVTG